MNEYDDLIVTGKERSQGKGPHLGECDMCGRPVKWKEEIGRKITPMAFFICSKCWEQKEQEKNKT
jgi:hypothetical protein